MVLLLIPFKKTLEETKQLNMLEGNFELLEKTFLHLSNETFVSRC
jgi:hypothetical protein